MEFIDGARLKHLIGGHPMELDFLLEISCEIADALAAAQCTDVLMANSPEETGNRTSYQAVGVKANQQRKLLAMKGCLLHAM